MSEPAEVWRLIQRADEVVKYANNRDPISAFAQARAALAEAESLLADLADQDLAANFGSQIQTRRDDIDGRIAGN